MNATYLCGKLECATHQYSKQSQKLQIWPLSPLVVCNLSQYIFTMFSKYRKETRVIWALGDICPANIYSWVLHCYTRVSKFNLFFCVVVTQKVCKEGFELAAALILKSSQLSHFKELATTTIIVIVTFVNIIITAITMFILIL